MKALEMRKRGMSYSIIQNELGIPKSTLSNWLRDMPYHPNEIVLGRIKAGQGKIGLKRHEQRLDEIEMLRNQGVDEVGRLTKRDLWMVGLGLWIGEGSKTIEQIRLVNSDPIVVRLFIRWLREICKLDNSNITLAMHLYPDSDEEKSKKYWARITGLPLSQFRKTQIDRRLNKQRSKAGKLSHGTLHITVASKGNADRGVRLHRRMMGWVAGVRQQS